MSPEARQVQKRSTGRKRAGGVTSRRALRIVVGNRPDWAETMRDSLASSGYAFEMHRLVTIDPAEFDLVVPMTTFCLNTVHGWLNEGRKVPALVPSLAAAELAQNKADLNNFLQCAGFESNIPKMWASLPDDPACYPIIVKPRCGDWGKDSVVLHEKDDDWAAKIQSEHLAQDYIRGSEEFATHILMHQGDAVFVETIRYTMMDEPHVKGIACREVERHWMAETPFRDLLVSMLRSIGYVDGLCCIDYRVDGDQLHLFEVNPRFGSSLAVKMGPFLDAYVACLKKAGLLQGDAVAT